MFSGSQTARFITFYWGNIAEWSSKKRLILPGISVYWGNIAEWNTTKLPYLEGVLEIKFLKCSKVPNESFHVIWHQHFTLVCIQILWFEMGNWKCADSFFFTKVESRFSFKFRYNYKLLPQIFLQFLSIKKQFLSNFFKISHLSQILARYHLLLIFFKFIWFFSFSLNLPSTDHWTEIFFSIFPFSVFLPFFPKSCLIFFFSILQISTSSNFPQISPLFFFRIFFSHFLFTLTSKIP